MIVLREVSVINIQPIEKAVHSVGQSLDVQSVFYTIQGEGPFCGQAAVFIRLAGCNLQCPGCDTDYTTGRQMMTVEQIQKKVWSAMDPDNNYHLPIVVITGGEPFRQNITPLVKLLRFNLFVVQIESNGSLAPTEDFPYEDKDVHIICSPKTGKINAMILGYAKAFKYVLKAGSVASDGLPILALDHTASPHVARPPDRFKGPVYVQPMDPAPIENFISNRASGYDDNVQACIKSAMTQGHILQLQTHKLLGLE